MSFQASSYVLELTQSPDGYRLNSTDKSVLHVLANNHNPVKRKAYPGVAYIASRACCSERSARDVLTRMEEHLVIERVRPDSYGRGRVTDYIFLELDSPERLKEKLAARQNGDTEESGNEPEKEESAASTGEPDSDEKEEQAAPIEDSENNKEGGSSLLLSENDKGGNILPISEQEGAVKVRERCGKGAVKGENSVSVIRKNLEPRTWNLEPSAREDESEFDAEKFLSIVNSDWVRPEQDTSAYVLQTAWIGAIEYELKNGCTTAKGAVTVIRGRIRDISEIVRSTWPKEDFCKLPRLATLLTSKRYHEADEFWRRTPKPGVATPSIPEITAAERLRMSMEAR